MALVTIGCTAGTKISPSSLLEPTMTGTATWLPRLTASMGTAGTPRGEASTTGNQGMMGE